MCSTFRQPPTEGGLLVDNAVAQHLPAGFQFAAHMHRTVELMLCVAGQVEITVQSERISVNAGQYLAIFPDIPHRADVPKGCPCSLLQTHFHSEPLLDLAVRETGENRFLLEVALGQRNWVKGQTAPQLEACLRGMEEELHRPQTDSQSMVRLYLEQLNILLSRGLGEGGSGTLWAERRLLAALRFISVHYAEKVTVTDVATASGVSTRYLSKLFHQRLQIGVAAYLTCFRISRAIALKYAAPQYPLTDLALDVGFSSLQHFSRVFKAQMGLSPKRYFSIQCVPL